MLIGHICVDSKAGKNKILTMLKESEKLRLAKVHLASTDDLEELYKLGQPSLSR